jgi:hypothetical protein
LNTGTKRAKIKTIELVSTKAGSSKKIKSLHRGMMKTTEAEAQIPKALILDINKKFALP